MIPIAAPVIGQPEIDAVTAVLRDGQLADGPEVRAFERSFAEVTAVDHAIATSNGTTALHAALVACGLGPGDRVLTTPFSFIASANAPRLAGCDIGFVDIDPQTYLLDPRRLEDRLSDGEPVDAVVAVHLYGLPADMTYLRELAESSDFWLIEDAAQAHGATHQGDPVGSLGHVGCFSFYPTKNMTTGEGGMVTTDDPTIAERVRSFIDHGRDTGYRHTSLGHNFRMTSIAAAVGRQQLERLPTLVSSRQANAARLDEALADTNLTAQHVPPDRTHAYNQYTVRHPDRDAVGDRLADAGIDTAVYYPRPIHRQPVYDGVDTTAPVAEAAAAEVLSLPVHPGVSAEEIDRIVGVLDGLVEVSP